MYSRRYRAKLKERRRVAGRKGARVRTERRLAEAGEWVDVGGLVTDGCLGKHSVRLLAEDGFSNRALAVVVDGVHRRPRTLRGVRRVLAEMMSAKGLKA